MQIVAKSGVAIQQLKDRMNKGAEFIELHLFRDDVSLLSSIEKVFKNIKESGAYVKIVHVPIDSKYNIEGLLTFEGYMIIKNTCELANMIAELNGEKVHVVMHHELELQQLIDWGMYNKILIKMNEILNNYKNIIINLENLTMLYFDESKITARQNFKFENVEICKRLRKDLNTDRIGTVFDTCHALSTIRHIKEFKRLGLCNELRLEEYFETNKDYLNIIHLANAKGFGYGEGHGVGFETEEEIMLLEKILNMIKAINYKGLLTLEVKEEDYFNCKVFKELKEQVEKILEKDTMEDGKFTGYEQCTKKNIKVRASMSYDNDFECSRAK